MDEELLKLLKELVAIESITCSNKECEANQYIYEYFNELDYFRKNQALLGKHYIENDPYGRFITFALVLGQKKKTVVISGHTDVVSAEVYGEAEKYAFSIGTELTDALSKFNTRQDLTELFGSDEWIWARGAADMKAGVALNMVLTKYYASLAEKGILKGSILFMALPDEESYSAGMRSAVVLLKRIKDEYKLDYCLMINPEPAALSNGAQVMSIGSVGKTLPVIMTQGVVAHMGHCFDGISALNMLAGIYQRTNGSLRFSDVYKDEATMPALWGALKDAKLNYDVSLPYRGYGYMTVLSFETTPEEILSELKKISCEVFEEEVEKLDTTYQEFVSRNAISASKTIHYDTCVYTVEELCYLLERKHGVEFDWFFENLKEKALKKINAGESYPDTTVYVMDELLNYAEIKEPLILIGLAPPYYPPVHSDNIKKKPDLGTKIYQYAKEISEREFEQPLVCENYFMGISDNSYTSVPDLNFTRMKTNYPLWGCGYDIDFEAIKDIEMPAILYGPIGIDYHQWSERVNKKSFLEVMPKMLDSVIEFIWRLE